MIVVTGGAGFIGSALVWALNKRGEKNIIIVDQVDNVEKEHNIAPLNYVKIVGITNFLTDLEGGAYDTEGIGAIFHLGACSDTTEKDWNYLLQNNVSYTKSIISWCAKHKVRCIYASSAAVYGNGEKGFSDDISLFDELKPLNLYGQSKLDVDIWARDEGYLTSAVGLRYFNVFGPNEYHKEHMRSVIAKKFDQLTSTGIVELFKSNNTAFKDGEFTRDFIYIKDAVAATLYFYDHAEHAGVYNVGRGEEVSWNKVANAMFEAVGQPPHITYIDMPEQVRDQYQYRTRADISKLRQVGYSDPTMPVSKAIHEYVRSYLQPHKHLGAENIH